MTAKTTKRGTHPNSLHNLHPGSLPKYQEKKKPFQLSLTPTAIAALKILAQEFGCSSPSELLERLARNEFQLEKSA